MSEGYKSTHNIVKHDASGIGQCTDRTHTWKRNNITACLFFIAVILLIYIVILNVQLYELRKKPCEKLLCYRENKRLQAEIGILKRRINNIESNHSELLNDQYYSHHVQVLLVFIIVMILVLIWMNIKDSIWKKTSEKTTRKLSNVPEVVYFSSHQLPLLGELTKSFLNNQTFSTILILEDEDLSRINSKLVFFFVDWNDRHIIMEGEHETSQLKRQSVEAVENAGGKVVVIYQFHLESDKLEDGCLYSEKLTSIQRHPVLKKLSKEECVLTIYKDFSEYQKTHLKNLCQRYLAF